MPRMPSYLNSDYQGILGTLDGETVTISVWGSGVVASSAPQTLADLDAAGNESTGTSYTRVDVEVEWSNVDQRLRIVSADLPALVDLDGDPDVKNIVFSLPGASDAARDVLAMFSLATAVVGFDGFSVNPVNGIAGIFGDDGPGTPETWGTGSTATAYLDRGRVWLDGVIATTSGSGALGTLPVGHRPATSTVLPVTVNNDTGGTPASVAARITIGTDGAAVLTSTVSLTGTISTPLTGLSFQVAS